MVRTHAGSARQTVLPTTVRNSEEHRFAVRTEHVFKCRANFIERAVRACAIENERDDVCIGARRRTQRIKALRDERIIA